ncbi:MAG: stage II sporulation protein M [Nanoarchaeota archaeon]|nr:stage II sporulation protein M [Nanoarchaeota archaeon]
MLDVFLKEKLVDKKPEYAFALGIAFATIGLLVAILIFKTSPSFPAVFLTAMAAAPVALRLIKKQEDGKDFFEKYKSLIAVYSYLFFGMAVSFAIWFAILPEKFVTLLFREQLLKFTVGAFTFSQANLFAILVNNFGLLFFFFLMSFFYGAGAMFLLAWNASILGTMWGNAIKALMSLLNPGQVIINVLAAFPYLFPEVAAYFFAAIAGGILSANMHTKKGFDKYIGEALLLFWVALALIIVSGVIETVILGI